MPEKDYWTVGKPNEEFHKIDEFDVRAAYRIALGRPPDVGLDFDTTIKKADDLAGLQRLFYSTPEFYRVHMRTIAYYTIGAGYRIVPGKIDVDVPTKTLEQLFRHIQDVWSMLGDVEPHFSVFSHPQFKPEQFAQHEKTFYDSGATELSAAIERLQTLGIVPNAEGEAVEFGCGVGRVTRHLADRFSKVTGFDVSAGHLALARDYIDREGKDNVKLSRIETAQGFQVPKHDFFYSKIVFQHNPPPVAKYFLDKALKNLRVGGIATFQVITGMANYKFDCGEYLSQIPSLNNQELHALPQHHVFELFRRHGITPLEVVRDGSAPGFHVVSTLFTGRRDS